MPSSLIKKRFADEIKQEVVERLVPRYWNQAQAEAEIDPMTGPQVEKVELEDGSPMIFTATVEVRPEFELSDDRDFDLVDPEVVVSGTDVAEILEKIRFDVGDWVEVDREAAKGDMATIKMREVGGHDHDGDHDHDHDDEEADDEGQTVSVELGDERVWEELTLALVGKKAGNKGEFTRTHTAAHEEGEEPHSHSHSFEFEVVDVKEKKLADLDDDLAKKVGDFENLEALETQIKANLETEKRNQLRQERESALLDQLRERNPIELPQGVVDFEVDQMLQDYAQNLMRSGIDVQNAGIDWQSMRDSAKDQAEKRVHGRLVLDAVAKADELTVSELEVGKVIDQIAQAENASPVQVRTKLMEDGRIESLKNQLLRDKAVRSLLGEDTDLFPEPEPRRWATRIRPPRKAIEGPGSKEQLSRSIFLKMVLPQNAGSF